MREGDRTFREELLNYAHRGHVFHVSNFADDSSPLGTFLSCVDYASEIHHFLSHNFTVFGVSRWAYLPHTVPFYFLQRGNVLHGFEHMPSSLRNDLNVYGFWNLMLKLSDWWNPNLGLQRWAVLIEVCQCELCTRPEIILFLAILSFCFCFLPRVTVGWESWLVMNFWSSCLLYSSSYSALLVVR